MLITERTFLNLCKDKNSGKRLLQKVSHLIPLEGSEELAKMVSYLTFDGHLSQDLKQIYLSSKDDDFLEGFSDLVESYLKFKGKYEICKEGFGTSKKYRVFSAALSRIFLITGTPSGNKSNTKFLVPDWIATNKDFSKAYLQIAFDSESSIWKDKSGVWRIRFKIHKNERLLENGKHFISQIKRMLKNLGVETTEIWTVNALDNKHGSTKGIVFGIKTKSFQMFLNNISFRIIEKRTRLDACLGSKMWDKQI